MTKKEIALKIRSFLFWVVQVKEFGPIINFKLWIWKFLLFIISVQKKGILRKWALWFKKWTTLMCIHPSSDIVLMLLLLIFCCSLYIVVLLLGCLHGTMDPKSCHNLVIFSTKKNSKFGDIIGKGLVVKMCDLGWFTS
jgi:hypothetical protein